MHQSLKEFDSIMSNKKNKKHTKLFVTNLRRLQLTTAIPYFFYLFASNKLRYQAKSNNFYRVSFRLFERVL